MAFWVYRLKCNDNSYYTGHTDNLDKRIATHQTGEYCNYTSNRLPVKLVYAQAFTTRLEALSSERQIKGWSRKKKEAMINGDWETVVKLARNSKIENKEGVHPSTSSGRTDLYK